MSVSMKRVRRRVLLVLVFLGATLAAAPARTEDTDVTGDGSDDDLDGEAIFTQHSREELGAASFVVGEQDFRAAYALASAVERRVGQNPRLDPVCQGFIIGQDHGDGPGMGIGQHLQPLLIVGFTGPQEYQLRR